MSKTFLSTLSICCLLLASVYCQQPDSPEVSLTYSNEELVIRIDIPEGNLLHVMTADSGPFFINTTIEDKTGFHNVVLLLPAEQEIPTMFGPMEGYVGSVEIRTTVKLSGDVTVTIPWVMCGDSCVPGLTSTTLTLP